MDEQKNKIEALLFTTGREMKVDEIAEMAGLGSPGLVKDILNKLKQEYSQRISGLEVKEDKGKWKLAIKKEYLGVTQNLLTDTEMDGPTQKTLAVIAYKNPSIQSDVIKVRGNKAYDHIKFLKENDFVMSEKHGRTRLLKLTSKFFDYFDVVENTIKEKFENVAKEVSQAEIDDQE